MSTIRTDVSKIMSLILSRLKVNQFLISYGAITFS